MVEDRRVRRTRQALENALLELIVEKGYDRITVQNLIDRADIGRSTFYAHYETKDDLLVSSLHDFTSDLLPDTAGDHGSILPARELFEHLGENHYLYARLIGGRGIDLITRTLYGHLVDRARAAIEGSESKVLVDVHAAYLAGSLMALLIWWLDEGMPHPPERMAEMFEILSAAARP